MMRSRSMMNADTQTVNNPKRHQQPQKSRSSQNFNYDTNSDDFNSDDDKSDSDFLLKPKKVTKRKSSKARAPESSFLPELSPYFFRGLRVFVKLSKTPQNETNEINDEMMAKFALEQIGAIIVEDPKLSDLVLTDELFVKSPEYQTFKRNRHVFISQIAWIKNFSKISAPIPNLSPNSSFKISNRSALSSPMINNDANCSHISQTPPKAIRVTGLKISAQVRHVILPSNSTSPSAAAAMNSNHPFNINPSINSIMNNKNNNNNLNCNDNIPNQAYSQRVNTRNLNDSYRKIQCLPIPSHYQKAPMIVVSDIRHLYAPITKAFTDNDQFPHIYLQTAPHFYFMTPFQPIPPNALQIARSCMLERMSKTQNKEIPNPNLKNNTNDVSAVIGKSNYYCYICRMNFDNPADHHNSSFHIRNTTPLWEEFDEIASSFNEIGKC